MNHDDLPTIMEVKGEDVCSVVQNESKSSVNSYHFVNGSTSSQEEDSRYETFPWQFQLLSLKQGHVPRRE